MAYRFDIPRGSTQSPLMPAEYCGASILVRYFNAGGVEIQPTSEGQISVSTTVSAEDFVTVVPSGRGLWQINGPAVRIRLSIVGTGAASASAEIWRYGQQMDFTPPGVFAGLRAMTQQGYIEANVKNGVQFYLQHNVPQIASGGAPYKLLFTTGAKKVLIKGREMYARGETVSIQVYKQPTAPAPGGTLLTVQNFNDDQAVPTSVSIRGGVTTTADGTSWGDPQRIFGQSAAGQRAGSGLAPGGDRVLKPSSTYLVVFRNDGSGVADIDYFLTWYEGGTDLPLRQ